MKKIIFYQIILLSWNICLLKAQHCSENYDTTKTINRAGVFDWRAENWLLYPISTFNPPIDSWVSPFYSASSNSNVYPIARFAEKDHRPEEGWELVKADIGTSNTNRVPNPVVILYNKYNAKLRVFVLITQLFSETGSNDAAKGGIIKLMFNAAERKETATLMHYRNPAKALDSYDKSTADTSRLQMLTPNYFNSSLPYWMYAEFPMAYDPCTCNQVVTLRMECNLFNQGTIDLDIKPLIPKERYTEVKNINNGGNFLSTLSSLGSRVGGAIKTYQETDKAVSDLGNYITDLTGWNPDIRILRQEDLNFLKEVENWIGLVPVVGKAAGSILNFLDLFIGGGKKKSGTQVKQFDPVAIINPMKASGTLTFQNRKRELNFSIPGSNQSNVANNIKPFYNNIMGLFNLMETPKVNIIQYTSATVFQEEEFTITQGERFLQIQLIGDLKYLVNPATQFYNNKFDILAALVVEDCYRGIVQTNLEYQADSTFQTKYLPLGCLKDYIATMTFFYRNGLPSGNEDFFCLPKIYLRVKAIMRRSDLDADENTQNVLFVAKYEVKINEYFTAGNEPSIANFYDNIQENVVIENVNITTNTTIYAYGTITVRNTITVANGVTLTLKAGREVIFENGTNMLPNIIVQIGLTNLCDTYIPPQTPSEISTFCNDANRYKPNLAFKTNKIDEGAAESNYSKYSYNSLSAYPNPATGQSTIRYSLAEKGRASIYLSNMLGEKVAVLIHQNFHEAGQYEVNLDSSRLPAALYFYTLETKTSRITKRLMKTP